MLYEESLLLTTFENTHLNTCESFKAAANRVLAFIGNCFPDFQKSKVQNFCSLCFVLSTVYVITLLMPTLSQESLDYYLLGQNRTITTLADSSHCYIVTKQMEQLVSKNFLAIKEFEEHLLAFHKQDVDRSSVKEVLLSHFEELFDKVPVYFLSLCFLFFVFLPFFSHFLLLFA
jgi:midasin